MSCTSNDENNNACLNTTESVPENLTLILSITIPISIIFIVLIIIFLIWIKKYKFFEKKTEISSTVKNSFKEKSINLEEDKSENSNIAINNPKFQQNFEFNYNHIVIDRKNNKVTFKNQLTNNQFKSPEISNIKCENNRNFISKSCSIIEHDMIYDQNNQKHERHKINPFELFIFKGKSSVGAKIPEKKPPVKFSSPRNKGKYLSKLENDFYLDYASKLSNKIRMKTPEHIRKRVTCQANHIIK